MLLTVATSILISLVHRGGNAQYQSNDFVSPLLWRRQGSGPACHTRTCDQNIVDRDLSYTRAVDSVQNEEYLRHADIGVVRRRKRDVLDEEEEEEELFTDEIELVTRTKRQLPVVTFGGYNVTDTSSLPAAGLILLLFGVLAGAVASQQQNNSNSNAQGTPSLPPAPPIVVVLPPPGQVPPGVPPPVIPADVSAFPATPEGTIPVRYFPPFDKPRTFPALCVVFSESDERSKQGGNPTYGRVPRRADGSGGTFWSNVRRRLSSSFPSWPALTSARTRRQYSAVSSVSSGPSYSHNQVVVARKFGYVCRVQLVSEACQLGLTCDPQGHRISTARQTGESFATTAAADCRTQFTGCGSG